METIGHILGCSMPSEGICCYEMHLKLILVLRMAVQK